VKHPLPLVPLPAPLPPAPRPGLVSLATMALAEILATSTQATTALAPALPHAHNHAERRWLRDCVVGVAVLRLRHAAQAGLPLRDDGTITTSDAQHAATALLAAAHAPAPLPPSTHPATALGVPRWLWDELAVGLGSDEAFAFVHASNTPGPITLRAHPAAGPLPAFAARLEGEGVVARANPIAVRALDVSPPANLFAAPSWRAGLFEVQDAASQRVGELVKALAPNATSIIDFCAGRGGKTAHLAALFPKASIWAHDTHPATLLDLWARARRLGWQNVTAGLPLDPACVVVVDAPCSSLGVLRRSPDLRFTLRRHRLWLWPLQQRHILAVAARRVRPGGLLVYATCSVLPAENNAVVAAAPPDFTVAAQERHGPHLDGGDGFGIWCARRAG
jgi:16S rRNA C967 or C1407 C5-methylase (RsmB/RsmF family)